MTQNSQQSAQLNILVIDDRELILDGTLDELYKEHSAAEIATAKTVRDAIASYLSVLPLLAPPISFIPQRLRVCNSTDKFTELNFKLMQPVKF